MARFGWGKYGVGVWVDGAVRLNMHNFPNFFLKYT